MDIEKLKEKVLSCELCTLYKTKKNYVFGEGSITSPIVFVGEAPGANEDKTGRPFVGRAGKILDELLKSIKLHRGGVYICNVLKCRPPNNRNPKPEEIKACTQYLRKQIDFINPRIICSMGNFASDFILKLYGLEKYSNGISKLHGRVFSIKNLYGEVKIIPLYHPAVATYNPGMKNILLEDMKKVKNILENGTKEE